MLPSGAGRRWAMVAGVVLALAAFLAWRRKESRAPATAPAASQPEPLPAERATPPPAPRPRLAAPAIQLAKRVEIRPARNLAPGALEGTVLDAETNAGIAGAELTFSHDNGAWSTTTGPGGAFRFAPRATGMYRLVSIQARRYASFEGEFGSSPVSFTSTEGNDISGVVLRLTPEDKARPRRRGRRDRVDAGDTGAPAARGSLRGRVLDARTGAPVVAFAIALWRRDGIALSRMLAPASFLDASGAYEITDLDPGTYEATAMAAGYAWSGYAVAQVDASPVQADFALRAGARIEGIVTEDTTRRPIAGAVISLEGRRAVAPNLPVAPPSPEAETGADGRFTLEQVPPDAMSLYAQKEGLPHAHRHARPASGRRRLSARCDRAHPARLRRRRQRRADRHRRRAGGATRMARGRRCRSRRRRRGCGPRAGRPDSRHRQYAGGPSRLRGRDRRDPRAGGNGGHAAHAARRARERRRGHAQARAALIGAKRRPQQGAPIVGPNEHVAPERGRCERQEDARQPQDPATEAGEVEQS
jgi:hypothetical protein